MRKIILVCGSIAGLISSAWCLFSQNYMDDSVSLNTRTYFGYASMILAFSLIYVGVKNYRDNQLGGAISFGNAMKVSLMITLVASTIYAVFWLIDYYFIIPDFGGKYKTLMHAQLVADGASAAEIKTQMADMNKYISWYKNPLFNVLITFTEIAPVGIVMSLIVSLILKSKPKTVEPTIQTI